MHGRIACQPKTLAAASAASIAAVATLDVGSTARDSVTSLQSFFKPSRDEHPPPL
jgi:hypothetical protein